MKAFLEILRIDMGISSIWPDIRLFSAFGIRPNIRQVKSESGRIPDIKKAGLFGQPNIR
jgi:hypothetical protein